MPVRTLLRVPSWILAVALALIAMGVLAYALMPAAVTPGPSHRDPDHVRRPPQARFQVTSPTAAHRTLATIPPAPRATPTTQVDVHLDQPQQRWWGTGATLTDSSVRLLDDHPRAVAALFDPHTSRGARLNMVRLPLSGTDFSDRPWTWSSGRPVPPELISSTRLLRDEILPLQPHARVVGTPWSAPPSMKSSGTARGGALADDGAAAYGDLLVGQARWLSRRQVPLWAMTLGNEPGYSSDYPTMTMTDDQMVSLADEVGPRLGALGVRLWAVDHNWADRGRVDDVTARSAEFDGAAFHCYAGEPGEMADLDVPRMITECTGTTDSAASTFDWDASNLVARAVAAGSSGLMMWNLALDPDHGPVDRGSAWGCKLCRGLITVGEPDSSTDSDSGFSREPEFYVIAHLARAADPDARVLPTTGAEDSLSTAAFRNPDGSVGVFGHNRTDTTQVVRLSLGPGAGTEQTYVVGPGELFSYRAPGR